MRQTQRRFLPILAAVLGLALAGPASPARAGDGLSPASPVSRGIESEIGSPNARAIDRLGIDQVPSLRFNVGNGISLQIASRVYDRAQISPLVDLFDSLPHGSELAKLKVYIATDEEISATCGAGTMACYDPETERMIVSGQSEEVDGIPREAVIAHEYGHHIANNRRGDIWSALSAGTPRWSTYEHICQLVKDKEAFPGNEGAHYWENPGEAFAQSYSQMVVPQESWYYSPLMRPDPTALAKLRMDVLHPWTGPHKWTWRKPGLGTSGGSEGVGSNVALAGNVAGSEVRFQRLLKVPLDGRVAVRMRESAASRYSFRLIDPSDGSVLVESRLLHGRLAHLSYDDCGQRTLLLEASTSGEAGPLAANVSTP